MVVCCTSIQPEERSSIADAVTSMGALHKLDLTSDVTHLIVGDWDTPKYKYVAREREDVKVLQKEWVEAVRTAWMQAEDLNLAALEKEYKYPTFQGLAICLTGFNDMDFRMQLAENITANGGDYRGDLTKTVTHLIAADAAGKKYQYAEQWGLKIVALDWYRDSLQRGLTLDHEPYHIRLKGTEAFGRGAWNREAKVQVLAAKRAREDDAVDGPPRKLRRSASQRYGSQSQQLWDDIYGSREAGDKEQALRPTKSMSNVRVRPVVLEAKSFTTDTSDGRTDSISKQHGREQALRQGIFSNAVFTISGFHDRKIPILKQHITSHGAVIVDSAWELPVDGPANFVLVPFDCAQADRPSLRELESHVATVTDLWLEKCLISKRYIKPGSHSLDSPIRVFPLPGFEDVVVNSTGFEGIERLHVSKVVKTLGATYDEKFRPGVRILISNTTQPSGEKLQHAAEWGIPVVNAAWLWACVDSGKIQAWKPYAIYTPDPHRKAATTEEERSSKPRLDTKSTRPERPTLRVGNPGADFAEEPPQRSKHESRARDPSGLGVTEGLQPLKEISPNSPTKRAKSPDKSKTIPAFDGAVSSENTQARTESIKEDTAEITPKPDSLNDAIEQLLSKQKRNLTRSSSSNTGAKSNSESSDVESKKKRLLGRALSNMSNSSSRSGTTAAATKDQQRPFSRASSIDSMNTDGLGSVLYDNNTGESRQNSLSRTASETAAGTFLTAQPGVPTRSLYGPSNTASFTARALAPLRPSSAAAATTNSATSSWHSIPTVPVGPTENNTTSSNKNNKKPANEQLHQQTEPPEQEDPDSSPRQTQLGYANPDDAVLLREILVENRNRTTSKSSNINTRDKAASALSLNGPGNSRRTISDDTAFMSIHTMTTTTTGGVAAGGFVEGQGKRQTRMRDRRREKERERLEREREEEACGI